MLLKRRAPRVMVHGALHKGLLVHHNFAPDLLGYTDVLKAGGRGIYLGRI